MGNYSRAKNRPEPDANADMAVARVGTREVAGYPGIDVVEPLGEPFPI